MTKMLYPTFVAHIYMAGRIFFRFLKSKTLVTRTHINADECMSGDDGEWDQIK